MISLLYDVMFHYAGFLPWQENERNFPSQGIVREFKNYFQFGQKVREFQNSHEKSEKIYRIQHI